MLHSSVNLQTEKRPDEGEKDRVTRVNNSKSQWDSIRQSSVEVVGDFDSEDSEAVVNRSAMDPGEVPDVIKPLVPLADKSEVVPLEELVCLAQKEIEVTRFNFDNRQALKQYDVEDQRLKAFILLLIVLGHRTKVWMPNKTVFDTRTGNKDDRVAGLGTIPGLQ